MHEVTRKPRGTLFVAAPLGVGRRLIAPEIAGFQALYPDIYVRLRLSDRKIDMTTEGLDVAFVLGNPPEFRPSHPGDRRMRPRALRFAGLHRRGAARPRKAPTWSTTRMIACCCAFPARPSSAGRSTPAMARNHLRLRGRSAAMTAMC